MKDYVGMGYHLCPVCLEKHDEVVLLDKRLEKTLERENFVGWELCAKHKDLFARGYVALIEVTNDSGPTLENARRTGRVAHLNKRAWGQLLNVEFPTTSIAFVGVEVMEMFEQVYAQLENTNG